MLPKIYGDFHKLDDDNRIRLTTVGTQRDLQRLGVQLEEGMALTLYMDDANDDGNSDDIMIDGTAHFSTADMCWVAAVNWENVYHASEISSSANGASGKQAAKIL